MIPAQQHQQRDRRSSSFSSQHQPSYYRQQPLPNAIPIPIPMRQPNPSDYQRMPPSSYPPQQPIAYTQQSAPAPVYARSMSLQPHDSHSHSHSHGEYGRIDEETEKEFERRYAREKRAQRELEGRPTLGGSLMSVVGKVGRVFGGASERR